MYVLPPDKAKAVLPGLYSLCLLLFFASIIVENAYWPNSIEVVLNILMQHPTLEYFWWENTSKYGNVYIAIGFDHLIYVFLSHFNDFYCLLRDFWTKMYWSTYYFWFCVYFFFLVGRYKNYLQAYWETV